MLLRHATCLLLALLLLAPAAAAFAARHDPVELAYDAQHAPVVLAAGALDLSGSVSDALLAAQVAPFTLRAVPVLHVDEGGSPIPKETTFDAATVQVESGTIVWRLTDGQSTSLTAGAPYGLGIAMAQAPIPSDKGSPGAGALVVGPDIETRADWAGGETQLVVLSGVVTIQRADGEAFPGWSHRPVNANATSPADAGAASILFRTSGSFSATGHSKLLAGATGSAANLTLDVSHAQADRFLDTVTTLSDLGSSMGLGADAKNGGGGDSSPFSKNGPLQNLAPLSGILNGALLVVNAGANNTTAPARVSTMGSDPFDAGPMSLLRSGGMHVAWRGDEMRVEGSPAVAITKQGFAVSPTPAVAGYVPVVSVILWVGAIAAIVFFFVKRPAKVEKTWTVRLLSWLAWLVVLAVVFVIWDASFADTFGTSVVTLLKAGDFDLPHLGVVFGLEMVPWSVAALLFALPVRILVGVILRVFVQGKPLSSVAKASGLVSLAVFGPIYALWIVNVGIQQAVAALAK